jgi:hypothetical protein
MDLRASQSVVTALVSHRLERRKAKEPATAEFSSEYCCAMDEWRVFPLRDIAQTCARPAILVLHAHAARESNSHNGLEADLECSAASAC